MAMERENRPARGGVRKRKKVCQFCVDKCEHSKTNNMQRKAPPVGWSFFCVPKAHLCHSEPVRRGGVTIPRRTTNAPAAGRTL